jgi:hypothetical protein
VPDDGLDHKSDGGHEAQQSWNQEHPGDTEPADSQGAGDAADRGGEPERGEVKRGRRADPVWIQVLGHDLPIPPRVAHIAELSTVAVISPSSLSAAMKPRLAPTPALR